MLPKHYGGSLRALHTPTRPSRFSNGSAAAPAFEILYLVDDPVVSLFEVEAMLGRPWHPGAAVPPPRASNTVVNVAVVLHAIVDLTTREAQRSLATSAQELTGDWQCYSRRGSHTPVTYPTGPAPTQGLGAALHAVPGLEGFVSYSAKVPYHRVLVIFPLKLAPGSSLVASDGDRR